MEIKAEHISLVTFGSNIPLFGNSEGSISTSRGFMLEFTTINGLPFLIVQKNGIDQVEFVNFANIKGFRVDGKDKLSNANGVDEVRASKKAKR